MCVLLMLHSWLQATSTDALLNPSLQRRWNPGHEAVLFSCARSHHLAAHLFASGAMDALLGALCHQRVR